MVAGATGEEAFRRAASTECEGRGFRSSISVVVAQIPISGPARLGILFNGAQRLQVEAVAACPFAEFVGQGAVVA